MTANQPERHMIGSDVLLEVGTNELEVLVFSLEGHPYSINVAKVREMMVCPPVHQIVGSAPEVEGVFLLRSKVVPLINLRRYLNMPPYPPEILNDRQSTTIIVTEFNNRMHAFRVDAVERILRISWKQIESLPRGADFESTPLTGIVHFDDRLIPMLDFEMVTARLGEAPRLRAAIQGAAERIGRTQRTIAIAEDSSTIQRKMRNTLLQCGYEHVEIFDNGEQIWNWLQGLALDGKERLAGRVDLVISDIEMPRMDGLHLTRLIREHPVLCGLPVVLFSSLASEDNVRKSRSVGATAHISKPDLPSLVSLIEQILQAIEVT